MTLGARNSFVVLDLQWHCQCAGHRSLHNKKRSWQRILAGCEFEICPAACALRKPGVLSMLHL